MRADVLRCANCGHDDARVRRVTRTFGEGADLLVVEQVPVVTCAKCGESYMTAATLHALDGLRASRAEVAVGRTVGVVRFDPA